MRETIATWKLRAARALLLREAEPVAADSGVQGTPSLFVVEATRSVLYVRKSGTTAGPVARDLRDVPERVSAEANRQRSQNYSCSCRESQSAVSVRIAVYRV